MPIRNQLAHHDLGVHQVFGAAETYKSDFQKVIRLSERDSSTNTAIIRISRGAGHSCGSGGGPS